ncbi:hypothetical protein GJ744_002468 [Endocarpon pusillum]|uniref:Uncharacterized protein n=1 Tax=Endocarpon pusillum TaxID=364733 RepID=A0A8H7A877_9EURO|nr:hypothetical protein GJ744_002468 [Endocarpon pusillum]
MRQAALLMKSQIDQPLSSALSGDFLCIAGDRYGHCTAACHILYYVLTRYRRCLQLLSLACKESEFAVFQINLALQKHCQDRRRVYHLIGMSPNFDSATSWESSSISPKHLRA